jgi:hypothetical protein
MWFPVVINRRRHSLGTLPEYTFSVAKHKLAIISHRYVFTFPKRNLAQLSYKILLLLQKHISVLKNHRNAFNIVLATKFLF